MLVGTILANNSAVQEYGHSILVVLYNDQASPYCVLSIYIFPVHMRGYKINCEY